jgi:hypothetical protein
LKVVCSIRTPQLNYRPVCGSDRMPALNFNSESFLWMLSFAS